MLLGICSGADIALQARDAVIAARVRPASRDYKLAGPRAEEWLLIEWPEGDAEPLKYWLATLAADTSLEQLGPGDHPLNALAANGLLLHHMAEPAPPPGFLARAPEYRAAVILRYWYDYSYIEIAQTLETTESAIKSRLFRARQMLADKLRPTETGHDVINSLLEGS